MCYVTATELKNNLSFYLEKSLSEDVYVTKNNKIITVLTNSDRHKLLLINEIKGSFGKVEEDIDYDELLKEEIQKRCTY